MKQLVFTALCCSVISSAYVTADMLDEGTLTLGVGGGVHDGLYKGQDTEDFAFPVISYENGPLSISGEGIVYRLTEAEDGQFAISAGLGVSGNSYKSSDADGLKGMSRRHDGVDIGAGIAWETDMGSFSAMVRQDVSDTHKGQQLDLGYEITLPVHPYLLVSPSAGISYQSEDYVDYYFGVKDKEATADRAAYKGDGTVNTTLGVSFIIPITDRWNIINANTYTWLGDGISDSPIVRKDKIWSTSLITTYTF